MDGQITEVSALSWPKKKMVNLLQTAKITEIQSIFLDALQASWQDQLHRGWHLPKKLLHNSRLQRYSMYNKSIVVSLVPHQVMTQRYTEILKFLKNKSLNDIAT